MSNKKLLDDLKDEILKSDIPNIYVDMSVVEASVIDDNEKKLQKLLAAETSTSYIINDTVFHDDDREFHDHERELEKQLLEFQLYAKMAKDSMNNNDKNVEYYDHVLYISTPGSGPDIIPDLDLTLDPNEALPDLTPLQFTMKENRNGTYTINGGLYLRWTQFHTLMYCDGQTAHCAVCDEKCNIYTHIYEDEHIRNLRECPPLKAFNLHWFRKIGKKYHCGICNELCNIKDSEDHKGTTEHKVYQLSALCQPTDSDPHIREIKKEDSQPHSHETKKEDSEPHIRETRKECIEFDDTKIITDDIVNGSCHDDSRKSEDYRENDYYDDYYEYGSEDYEVSEGGDDPGVGGDGASYASMAKKNDVAVELGDRIMQIKFDTYHMVTNIPQEFSFFCIVCKCLGSLKMKLKHCEDAQHLANVNRCRVEQYKECIVRDLDNKLYHCQLCNTAQPKLQFEKHMESHRPSSTNDNDSNDSTILRRFNNFISIPLIYSQNRVRSNNRRNSLNRSSGYNDRLITHLPGIYDMIVLKIMESYVMVIPVMSYNFICKREEDFFCALCDRGIADGLKRHIYNVGHVKRLQRAEFLTQYGNNIIRVVRGIMHCAICNIPIELGSAETHIAGRTHQELRSKAIRSELNKIFNTQRQPSKRDNGRQRIDSSKVIPVVKNDVIETTRVPEPVVKKDVIETTRVTEDEDLDSTLDSEVTFDFEEFVYLQLKKELFKILNLSYHTLVPIGDGDRYCFMCDQRVELYEIQRHVDSRRHTETIEGNMFLEKYEYHLLRQYYLEYHCAICNVIVPEKEIRSHIDWPTHILLKEELQKHATKARKKTLDGKTRLIHVYTQPTRILTNVEQKKTKIYLNTLISKDEEIAQILPNEKLPNEKLPIDKLRNEKLPNEKEPNEKLPFEKLPHKKVSRVKFTSGLATPQSTVKPPELCKKSKIIATLTHELKVSWDTWHSVAKTKNGYKCILCQKNLQLAEFEKHCLSEWHTYALDLPICEEYLPAVLRRISESMLHCMFCNAEVENKESSVQQHLTGKKHIKNLEAIITECSKPNAYENCNPDRKDYSYKHK